MKKRNLQQLVYVGCGHHRMKGFIHVEISINKDKSGQPEILADMTEKIPLEENSVDLIFSRATLEHLTYRELINHFLECFRILKPGGCIRIVVPSFDMMIHDYHKKIYWPDMEKNPDLPNENYTDTFVASMLYHDHFYLHNFDTLRRTLEKTGFAEARECNPGDTAVESAKKEILKAEIARFGEIIVEAKKGDKVPKIKRYKTAYPHNPLNKFLAKYFNIKITVFKKRKPVFPSTSWFKEKLTSKNHTNTESKTDYSGSHGQKYTKPKHEDKLDISIPLNIINRENGTR